MRDIPTFCLELVDLEVRPPDFWHVGLKEMQKSQRQSTLMTAVVQVEAIDPKPALTSTKCSFKAEKDTILPSCLWEECRPEHGVFKSPHVVQAGFKGSLIDF